MNRTGPGGRPTDRHDARRPAPGRRDIRRPGGGPGTRRDTRTPAPVASSEAARRLRDALPRYWFAERLLAVLSGRRPVHWMLNHTVGDAYEQLVLLAPLLPLRIHGHRPVVRFCDEYAPRDGVIEAFARISAGERVRAMAFRLEQGPDQRWRCAAVELGGERPKAERA